MSIACQESLKYFSKIWACLVGSVLILPVSGSFTAWRLARGCAYLPLIISLWAFFGVLFISCCCFLRAMSLSFLLFRASLLVIACLVYVYMSSSCFLRGWSGTMCFISWIAFMSAGLALVCCKISLVVPWAFMKGEDRWFWICLIWCSFLLRIFLLFFSVRGLYGGIWGEWPNSLSKFFYLFSVVSGTFGCARAGFEGYLVYWLNKTCH